MKPLGERPSFQLPRKNFPKSNGETHQKLQWVLITKFQQLGWLKLEFTTKHALTVSPSHSVNQLSKLVLNRFLGTQNFQRQTFKAMGKPGWGGHPTSPLPLMIPKPRPLKPSTTYDHKWKLYKSCFPNSDQFQIILMRVSDRWGLSLYACPVTRTL